MQKIILATHNMGKVAELKSPFLELGFEVDLLPSDFPEIIEDGSSFEENALIKAKAVCKALKLPALADDSGLCVLGLNNAPGIYSARYADDYTLLDGENKDLRNIRKLLENTKNFSNDERNCAFHCAMALVFPNGQEIIVHETWKGKLLKEKIGEHGFGYDPIFFDEELNLSAAQMDKNIKMSRSHRAKAIKSLFSTLQKISG